MSEHTPLPWVVKMDKKLDVPRIAGPVKENGMRDVVAIFPIMGDRESCGANAALIVQAVNSHAALVEALSAARSALSCVGTNEYNDTCGVTFTCYPCQIGRQIDAALEKAGVK